MPSRNNNTTTAKQTGERFNRPNHKHQTRVRNHAETQSLLTTSSETETAPPHSFRRPRSTNKRDRDAQRPRPQGRVSVESMTLKEAYSVPKHTSAICVQSFDDSLNSAIHITYRISLRSSSLREPRYPLLRVLDRFDSA